MKYPARNGMLVINIKKIVKASFYIFTFSLTRE